MAGPFTVQPPGSGADRPADASARSPAFGTVWINDHFMLVSEMPHGGLKESGNGKDRSMYAVEDYTVVKHVMLKI